MEHIYFYKGDLPAKVKFEGSVAVDTETMGLNLYRDRLCLVQLGDGKGHAYLVQIEKDVEPVNLKKLFTDERILKIFHFARFDVAKIKHDLGVLVRPVYCTKIAHKLVRPSAASHSLKSLCQEMLGISLDKEEQQSDWGVEDLTAAQKKYAANDVLYLHALKGKLDELLEREERTELAEACFDFIGTRAELDLLGFDEPDIFQH